MTMANPNIDGGKEFDWGRVSAEYAKYRDIYPPEFYDRILARSLCRKGQSCLDIGTGTGVLPRNLYRYGAAWTATDISENQIAQARKLSEGMQIEYYAIATEDLCFPDASFDVITACQCFWYFDHGRVMPNLFRMLKPNGRLLVLYMAWLPYFVIRAPHITATSAWPPSCRTTYRGIIQATLTRTARIFLTFRFLSFRILQTPFFGGCAVGRRSCAAFFSLSYT